MDGDRYKAVSADVALVQSWWIATIIISMRLAEIFDGGLAGPTSWLGPQHGPAVDDLDLAIVLHDQVGSGMTGCHKYLCRVSGDAFKGCKAIDSEMALAMACYRSAFAPCRDSTTLPAVPSIRSMVR